jgi:transglutaminase-like putative cysteine protease
MVEPHPDAPVRRAWEEWQTEPAAPLTGYGDLFGNRCRRVILPAGAARLRYDAEVELSRTPDAVEPTAAQVPVEQLPDSALVYTLPSRYCLSDALADDAWRLFGDAEPGWARVQAVCDWINAHIQYGGESTPLTTALDVYEARAGVCRDFAHLGVAFCRALTIPARYVFGYMPDIDVPPPYPPMDFHAWFEAYLGGRWWTFDARFNRPRIGRVPIGRGRDAVDVAMVTTFGPARFRSMTVWTDEISADAPPAAVVTAAGSASEAGVGA